MPFYEYECSACKYYLEALQKISDAPLKKCPSCGKSTLKRLVSAPVFRLKGSGWYETDFKSENETKRNLIGEEKEASAADKTETSGAAEPKSESKEAPASAPPKKSAAVKKPAAKPTRAAPKKKVPAKKAKGKGRR